jgi:hypothetical protein
MQKSILISLFLFILVLLSGCSQDSRIILNESLPINITYPLTEYNDIPTATHTQQAIFEGRAYILSGDLNFSIGQTQYFIGCTQDKDIHFENFLFSMSATPFDVHFYKNPTITNNGTLVYAENRNDNYNINSSLSIYLAPSITNNGTLWFHSSVYGGNNIAGTLIFGEELILAPNNCYLFSITNNDGNNVETTFNQ